MNVMNKLEILSTRDGFNSAVRHVKSTISIVEALATKTNLADLIAAKSASDEIGADRLAVLLRMVLADKMKYRAISRNLNGAVENIASIADEISKWKAVDLVLAYNHPDLGLVIANPKNADQLAEFGLVRKRELAVVYAGKFEKPADDICEKAANLVISLLEGSTPKIPSELYTGEFVFKAPTPPKSEKPAKAEKKPAKAKAGKTAPKAVAAKTPVAAVQAAPQAAPAPVVAGPRPGARMTPQYSVVVSNELFHNGNVEAWKRIVASYKTKYPSLEVYIYYDGERITDINSLFKWGKVKHGSTIQFAVAGTDIKDVAKLQRYLMQGASHQFEAFLHGPVSTPLKLF